MDELDRLLTETMWDAAGQAPADTGLLAAVRERSREHYRRRVATVLSAAVVAVAAAVPSVIVLATRTPPRPSPPATAVATTDSLTLVRGYQNPVFPYALSSAAGHRPAVTSLVGGNLIALFEATDLGSHSDITLTVSPREPVFAAPATKSAQRVRGHAGALRVVDARPAKQLTLIWRESPDRWVQLATDDTYTRQQVVAVADALTTTPAPVLPPFTLDLRPAGLTTDTVTPSTMRFRSPGGAAVTAVLRKRRHLTPNQTVGAYPAELSRGPDGVVLAVDVTDWGATLEITVDAGLPISDVDLVRFAAGVHVLNRSDPQ